MTCNQDLSSIELFKGISEKKLAEINKICNEITVKTGEQIFCEGCDADQFYILIEGNVQLNMKLTSRPETLVLGVINKFGQSFGWSVIVDAQHYTATAEAKEDSRMIAIKGSDIRAFMEKDKEVGFDIAMRMAEIVSSRLRYYRVLLKTF